MNKNWIRCLSLITVLAVFMTFSIPVSAKEVKENNEKERISELAEALEFIFEEASTKDAKGNIIDIDIDMIEDKYGENLDEDLDLDDLKSNLGEVNESNNISPMMIMPPDAQCTRDELNSWAKEVIPTTVISTIYGHLLDGEYMSAAKKLVKSGVKGSVVGIATKLTIVWFKCH